MTRTRMHLSPTGSPAAGTHSRREFIRWSVAGSLGLIGLTSAPRIPGGGALASGKKADQALAWDDPSPRALLFAHFNDSATVATDADWTAQQLRLVAGKL